MPGYRALILRRTFQQLAKGDALIPRSHEWLARSDARWNEQKRSWTFPSGATLEFGHVEHETSKYDYQGAAYQFVGFDELTHFTESQYEYIGFSRARRRTDMAAVPIRTRATANPGGIGHGWVKRRFIDRPGPGVVFIPAKVEDNPGLDRVDYAASLAHLPDALRRQLLDGDWGAFQGQAYPMFDPAASVVPAFAVPRDWQRFEQVDHGLRTCAWHPVAVDYEGNLIVFDEYYRGGLVSEHAAAILERRAQGWETRDSQNWLVRNTAWADPSIRNRTGTLTKLGDPATLVTEYGEHGIALSLANNDPRAGHARLAELLTCDPQAPFPVWHPRHGERGAPRYYVLERCPQLIEQLQAAPLKEEGKHRGEIVDPDWETDHGHAHAAARYGAMSRPRASAEPEPVVTDEHALREEHARRTLARIRERELYQFEPI